MKKTKKVTIDESKNETDDSANEENIEGIDADDEEDFFHDASEDGFSGAESVPTPIEKEKPKVKSTSTKTTKKTTKPVNTKKTQKEKATGDTDQGDNFSVFSNNSLIAADAQTVVFLKLRNSYENAQEVLLVSPKSLVSLEDAKKECQEALKHFEKEAPKLENVSVQEVEEIDHAKLMNKNIIKKLNTKIENVMKKKEDKKEGPKPTIPDFHCYASSFLQWRKEFKASTKQFTELQRISAMKRAIKPKSDQDKTELNKIFSNNSNFKQLDKALVAK